MRFLLSILIYFQSCIAIALDPVGPCPGESWGCGSYIVNPELWNQFLQDVPGWIAVMVPFVVLTVVGLRLISSGLFWVSKMVPSSIPAYRVIVIVVEAAAFGFGYIGIGMPKDMLLKKASKIAREHIRKKKIKS